MVQGAEEFIALRSSTLGLKVPCFSVLKFLAKRRFKSARTGPCLSPEPEFPKGTVIRTLLKDLPPSTLGGGALFHEHLSIDLPPIGPPQKTPPPPQATADVDYIIGEIKTAGSEGVSCIVDGGHPDMGRKLDYLKKIATSTNVHIVASGGFYMEGTYPPDLATKSEDQIADDLVREASANRYGAFGEIGES